MKMNVMSYTALILFCCSFIQGLCGLRLTKVAIPAYKLRGESTYLECQYELNRPNLSTSTSNFNSGSDMNMNTSYNQRSRNNYQQRYEPYDHSQDQYHYHHRQDTIPDQQQNSNMYKVYEEQGLKSHQYSSYIDNIDDPQEQLHRNHQSDGTNEALYAVKWYKDNEEFYRYVPRANPPKQSYQVDGIRVDEKHSDSTKVFLRGLTLNSTGLYKCEVSAEAPNFSSVQGEGRMEIVYLPRDGPHIKGKEDQYQIGDILNLNCTSGKSHPASRLQWFINDEPLTDSNSLIHYNHTVHKHGLITSTLGLQLTVDARHFHDGAMRVKCVAKVSPVLWKGDKESILQRRPGLGLIDREAMLLVLSSSSQLTGNRMYILVALVLICLVKFYQFIVNFHIR